MYENQVADMLWDLPAYDYYVPDQEGAKKQVKFNVWARPTIPWSLECESSTSDAVGMFDIQLKKDPSLELRFTSIGAVGAALTAFFGFAGFCFFGIPMVCCIGGDDPGPAAAELSIATIVNRLCWTVFSIPALVRLGQLKDITEANVAIVEDYYDFDSTCTDEYSQINTEALMDQVLAA